MAFSDRSTIAFASRLLAHPLDRAHQTAGAARKLAFQLAGDRLDQLADGPYLLRHHRKARTLRAGARALDQRIQRQHLHLVGDLLDRPRFLAGDLVHLGGETADQRGDIGFILGGGLGLRFGGRSCSVEIKSDGHFGSSFTACPTRHPIAIATRQAKLGSHGCGIALTSGLILKPKGVLYRVGAASCFCSSPLF